MEQRRLPTIQIVMINAETGFGKYNNMRIAMGSQKNVYTSREVNSLIQRLYKALQVEYHSEACEDIYNLTSREKDILILLKKGYSNAEIANEINLTIQTVKNYLTIIYDKMGVKNRIQAIFEAGKYQ